MKITIKKIGVLVIGLGASLVLAISNAAVDPYAKYRGIELNVMFPDIEHHRVVSKVLPEFTAATGIRVNVTLLKYLAARKEQAKALKDSKGKYDLVSYVVMDKGPHGLSGGLVPLGVMFSKGALNDPKYDILDFVPAYMENIGMVGGHKGYLPGPSALLVGLPFGAETSVLGYRKDILEKYNLAVPTTYDELISAMCLINEREPGMYGLASRGAIGHQISHAFLLHLAPYGVRIFDQEWNPVFNTSAGLKALTVLKKIAECGHPDMAKFGASDSHAAFRNGQTAFYLDTTISAASFEDPTISRVVGKVGWGLHPIGVRRGSQSGGFGIGIPANSQNKEAAFLLLQWLTSKTVDKKVSLQGGSPVRISTLLDAEVNRERPYMKTFEEALRYSDSDWRPLIPEWDLINSPILGQGIHKVVFSGADPQQTLDEMAEQVRSVMDQAGYYNFQRD